MKSFVDRFSHMKSKGNHIQYVLDIGAYRGDFTNAVKTVWSSAIVRQFEADERQKKWLSDSAIFALLGDTEKSQVDFFTLPEDKITTGSSVYRELTTHYSDSSVVIQKKPMTTIDALDSKHNFFGNWKHLGLVKIDTQGSELLILDGAKNFLKIKQPKYILLECSVQRYNSGSPLAAAVIEYMNRNGYDINDVFDLTYSNGTLLQMDILFEAKK